MTERDIERLREFFDVEQELDDSMEWLEIARKALKRAKHHAPATVYGEIDGLHGQIGQLKTRLNEDYPSVVKRQAGAKHQARTSEQEQYERRPGGDAG